MLQGLLVALVAAPLYWLLVPSRWRRETVTAASLAGLGLYDPRLLAGLLVLVVALHGCLRAAHALPRRRRWPLVTVALAGLVALFLYNKLGAQGGGALPSQSGLVLLGVSYLVLKAAAVLARAAKDAGPTPVFRDLLAWIAFLPTYPSGPIEELDHFLGQQPVRDAARIGFGLQRILFGLVKALILSTWLGDYATARLAVPADSTSLELLLATYAFTLRFFLDFAGYSDVAIGLAAVYGFEIQENFDKPLLRRNLVQLWQGWHMTLTRWLRVHLFVPISRSLLRRGPQWDVAGPAVAQLATMLFCGLWHGVGVGFALWGLAQGAGLLWVSLASRRAGAWLPAPLRGWWRASPVARVASTGLTVSAFAFSNLLLFASLPAAGEILRAMLGAR